jgi:hypothetical protein
MLWQASQHVSESPFHALCLKLVKAIREAGGEMKHQQARRALRGVDARQFTAVVEAAAAQGEITLDTKQTGGRPCPIYRTTS